MLARNSGEGPIDMLPEAENIGYRWALGWAFVTLLITCLPYLFAVAVAYPNRFFVGALDLPDDAYVYLAWMRQAQEGRVVFVNRFTTAPQHGGFFNILFLALGNFSRVTHLPLVLTFHLARVAFGIAFLVTVYRLLSRLLSSDHERRAAYLLICFGAGLGWLFPRVVMASPTDLWQAETNSFLSLYLNPLFAAALWLMALTFERLWTSQRTGRWEPAVAAGAAGLVLANIHSYDILIVWGVWACYLGASALLRSGLRRSDLIGCALLFLLPLPAVWQQWHFYQVEAVFRARALTPTLSSGMHWYLLGLGLLVPLGLLGARTLNKSHEDDRRAAGLFLLTWAVVGLGLPYLPLSFQRKLAMGIEIPWACLSGAGLVGLSARIGVDWNRRRAALAVCIAISSLTLVRWFSWGLGNIESNWCEGYARLFLGPEETSAFQWLSVNARGGSTLAMPLQLGGVAGYLPGLAGVTTYAGHWGETPDFPVKLREIVRFYSPSSTDEQRREFLRRNGIRYVSWGAAERAAGRRGAASPAPADLSQMAGLKPVFQSGADQGSVTVFRVE